MYTLIVDAHKPDFWANLLNIFYTSFDELDRRTKQIWGSHVTQKDAVTNVTMM
jgi:hypothetical protein